MAQSRARSRYLRFRPDRTPRPSDRVDRPRDARRPVWSARDGLAAADGARVLARGGATALLIGAAGALGLELATVLAEAAGAVAQTAATPETAVRDGARRWSELATSQKLSVIGALATVASVAVGAVVLARRRARARWLAAVERRRLVSALYPAGAGARPAFERPQPRRSTPERRSEPAVAAPPPTTPKPAPETAAAPAVEAVMALDAYLDELRRLVRPDADARSACASRPRSAPVKDDPIAWRTAHARRRSRFRRLLAEPEISYEDRQTALRDRIAKLGLAETARRKSSERVGALRL